MEQEGGAFAEFQGLLQGLAQCLFRGRSVVGFLSEVGDEEVDVVLAIAVELFEICDRDELSIDAEDLVSVITGPVGQRLVVALASADELGAKIEVRCFGVFLEQILEALAAEPPGCRLTTRVSVVGEC